MHSVDPDRSNRWYLSGYMVLGVWVDTSQLCVQGVVGYPSLISRNDDSNIVSLSINQMIQNEQKSWGDSVSTGVVWRTIKLFSNVTRIIDHVHCLLFSNFIFPAYHVAGSCVVCWGFGVDIAVVSPIICSGRFCVPLFDFMHD